MELVNMPYKAQSWWSSGH